MIEEATDSNGVPTILLYLIFIKAKECMLKWFIMIMKIAFCVTVLYVNDNLQAINYDSTKYRWSDTVPYSFWTQYTLNLHSHDLYTWCNRRLLTTTCLSHLSTCFTFLCATDRTLENYLNWGNYLQCTVPKLL